MSRWRDKAAGAGLYRADCRARQSPFVLSSPPRSPRPWGGGIGLWSADHWNFGSAISATYANNDPSNQFNVFIDGSEPAGSQVTLDTNVAVDSLTVDEDDTLVVSPGHRLSVIQSDSRASSGTIANGGTIELESTATASGLLVEGDVTLSGGGRLVLSGPADELVCPGDQDPSLRARSVVAHTGASGSLANENHRIEGSGALGFFDLELTNGVGGMIDADVAGAALVVAGRDNTTLLPGMTNLGVMQASDGGILRLYAGTYDQAEGGAAGTIQALAGSTVHVENSGVTIQGGALNSAAGGEILVRDVSRPDRHCRRRAQGQRNAGGSGQRERHRCGRLLGRHSQLRRRFDLRRHRRDRDRRKLRGRRRSLVVARQCRDRPGDHRV